jgi:mediator of RNA polymerase II transcription subunit 12
MIKARITQHGALAELEDLMNEIFSRRADHVPAMPYISFISSNQTHILISSSSTSTFRMPSRVTLNDSKRQAWFADLANPDVPLHKLGKNVPHGAKGHDLLDLLQSHNVEISRAVWFLRVFGANETVCSLYYPSCLSNQI